MVHHGFFDRAVRVYKKAQFTVHCLSYPSSVTQTVPPHHGPATTASTPRAQGGNIWRH